MKLALETTPKTAAPVAPFDIIKQINVDEEED